MKISNLAHRFVCLKKTFQSCQYTFALALSVSEISRFLDSYGRVRGHTDFGGHFLKDESFRSQSLTQTLWSPVKTCKKSLGSGDLMNFGIFRAENNNPTLKKAPSKSLEWLLLLNNELKNKTSNATCFFESSSKFSDLNLKVIFLEILKVKLKTSLWFWLCVE